MRKVSLIAALVCLGFAPLAQAQDAVMPQDGAAPLELKSSRPLNTLTIAPISLAFGAFGVEYEHAFGDRVSFMVAPDYRWGSVELTDGSVVPQSIIGLNVGARVFLLGDAPSGLWIGPEGGALIGTQVVDGERVTGTVPRLAAMIGGTAIIGDVFTLSGGVGVQMFVPVPIPLPQLRLSMGVAF